MNRPLPLLLVAIALAAGCASEVVRQPAALQAAPAGATKGYVTTRQTDFRLDSGYERSIAAGTEFEEVGAIPQGRVLKPRIAVLTVEGAHVHEAYAVVTDGRLVGFYLPVERAFAPLALPVNLPLEPRR
jgi:hypothetical protein